MRRRRAPDRLALLVLGSCLAAGAARGQLAIAPNEPAPVLEGIAHGSFKPWTVDWSEGKLTLVNFWAEWCEPCKELMPRLQDLYLRRGADGLRVIGVHEPDLSVDQVRDFLRPLNVTYPILRQSRKRAAEWGVTVLPTSYLVDAEGRIVRRYAGARRALADALISDAEAVLEGRPLGTLLLPQEPPPSGADGS